MNAPVRNLLHSVTIFVVAVTGLWAQRYDADSLWNLQPPSDTIRRNILIGGRADKSFHLATDLQCLDGNCKPFEGGDGSSYGFTITGFQEFDQYINLSVGLGLNMWDANMSITDSAARVRMPNGSISTLVRELTMNAHGMTLAFSAGALYMRDNLVLGLSPVLEFNLSSPQWSQNARILAPSGVAYPDGSNESIVVPERPIPDAAGMRFGFNGMVGYDVAVSGGLNIVPMLTVQYMPTAIRSGTSWSDVRVAGSVAVRFDASKLPDTVERIRTTIKIDTVRTVRPSDRIDTLLVFGQTSEVSDTVSDRFLRKISTRIARTDTIVVLDSSLRRRLARERRLDSVKVVEAKRPTPSIRIGGKAIKLRVRDAKDSLVNRRFVITEDGDTLDYGNQKVAEELAIKINTQKRDLTFMVMPSVFFDSGSARLPNRYRILKDTVGYRPEGGKSQHEMNLDVINVMGYRMALANESLIIRGYADESSEGGSCELARARAQSIVDVLTSVWGIDQSRLRIDVGTGVCLANPASSGVTARGREENRRVDIFAADNQYFQPIQRTEVLTKADWDVSQAQLEVSDTLDPVVSWKYSYEQRGRVIQARSGDGRFEETSLSLPRDILDSLGKDPVILSVMMTTKSGENVATEIPIPVDSLYSNVKFESLSLAMFAVRSTDLGQRDVDLLKLFASKLEAGDRVAVIGYSDDLGNPALNQQLSLRRAESVAQQLKTLRSDCQITRTEGLGSSRFPIGVFSYDFPEQRFMSRTVQLVLEKQ